MPGPTIILPILLRLTITGNRYLIHMAVVLAAIWPWVFGTLFLYAARFLAMIVNLNKATATAETVDFGDAHGTELAGVGRKLG